MADRPRARENGYPKNWPAKMEATKDGVRYELPFRKSNGTIGWVIITTFDHVDDPLVSIWESARARAIDSGR